MSSANTVLSRRPSGTSPLTIRCARPSTIAVLPTPGSPISTGLFLVLRLRIWIVRRISSSRPITGSILSAARFDDEVAAVLLERLVGRLGRGRGDALRAADGGQRLEEAVMRDAVLLQDPPRRRVGLEHRQQQVLDGDVLVVEALGLLLGAIEQQPEAARDGDLLALARTGDAGPALERLLDGLAQRVDVHLGAHQQPRHEPVVLVEQREQQVLDVDLGVPVAQRLGLGVVQGLLALLGELVRVHLVHLS